MVKLKLQNAFYLMAILLSGCGVDNKNDMLQQRKEEVVIGCHIKSLNASNKLFSKCVPGSQETAFLMHGGEYFPDYENPRTLNDKVAYILRNYYNKSPVTDVIGNKYFAKKYISDAVGSEYVAKLYGVWDNPKDIQWDKLPNKFVLKSVRGHFGGQVIVVHDKSKLNIGETIKKLEDFCNLQYMSRYKSNRIIAEEYLSQPDGRPVSDYKIFCSFGKSIVAYCLAVEKGYTCDPDEKTMSFYSVPNWERIPMMIDENIPNFVPKPKGLDKMIKIAEKLSKSFPLIRIDFYEVGDRVIVGELTEDASGAKSIMKPVIWDFKFGELIDIPSKDEINKLIERDKKQYGNVN